MENGLLASRRIIGTLLAVAAFALLFVGVARAHPYWFFQGYLPKSDGTREVFKANVCCDRWNETRMSWEVGSHEQCHVLIRRSDYGWDRECNSTYDSIGDYSTEYYVKAGCQNPYPWGATWTNCRVDLPGG